MIVNRLDRWLRLALFVLIAGGALSFVLTSPARTPYVKSSKPSGRASQNKDLRAAANSIVLGQLTQARAEAQEETALLSTLRAPRLSPHERAEVTRALIGLEADIRAESAITQTLAFDGLGAALVTVHGKTASIVVDEAHLTPIQLDRIGFAVERLAGIAPEAVTVRPRSAP